MIKVGEKILNEGFIKLKDAFIMSSPGVSYTSLHARRKLLQMPLVSIGVGDKKKGTYCLYLVEKQPTVHYKVLKSLLNKLIQSQCSQTPINISRETVDGLLKLAESDAEKHRLKYAIVKAAGLSSSRAKNVYGFNDMSSKVTQVENALEEATCIREAIENIAKVKDEAIARSLGIFSAADESSTDSSETDSDFSDDDGQVSKTNLPKDIGISEEAAGTECRLSDQQLSDFLRSCDFNWIEFVRIICKIMHVKPLKEVEHELDRFAEKLQNLNICEDDLHLVSQSRKAYALQRIQREKEDDIDNGVVLSESDLEEPDALSRVQDPLDEIGKAVIMKKRASIQRKAKREIKKRIEERRFLRRRRSKKIGKIQNECPDIGNTIEEFVRKRGVGADSWRRTGVLTFDGNRRVGKKVTFRSIQTHLQAKYKRNFSYGTVVQLCVPRNKRRQSAIRYKGLAQVTQRRARKGFTLKYNPDDHWSAAMYNGLDDIQYKDGNLIMNAGRDDQAGFRLDTMTTSKQHGTLCVNTNLPLTTRTDYVNPYPSVLQTTCYNFPATCTTGEVCAGVVKAKPLFYKNPAQHFADMLELQEQEEIKPVFTNNQTGKIKDIECIRVDGGADEGPVHEEVQYWWTKRHIKMGTKATMVTTRSSGSSFKNRVELQNGCLALGHANLFIPSTLNGSCMDSGKVNEKILCQNLDAAIDVYISRVDKTPCARTEIHLIKGSKCEDAQKEREILLVFLKGKKDEKNSAKLKDPVLYNEIERTWQLRSRHMVKQLPIHYVFYLKCCYRSDCMHPVCKAESSDNSSDVWYPGGPSLDYFPSPTPDPDRPYGSDSCEECVGFCAGHYLKPDKLLSIFQSGKKLAMTIPPSQVLTEAFKNCAGFPTDEVIKATAEKVLLKPEDVKIWFQHLQVVEDNRKMGAKKAAATRKAKAKNKEIREKTTERDILRDSDDDEVCNICYSFNPPHDADQNFDWVACDSCALWYHTCCVNFENSTAVWLCNICMR